MDLYEIVTKLAGPVESVGETNSDEKRLGNLKSVIELTDKLLSDISRAAASANYPEASRAKIGRTAQDFLDGVRQWLTGEVE